MTSIVQISFKTIVIIKTEVVFSSYVIGVALFFPKVKIVSFFFSFSDSILCGVQCDSVHYVWSADGDLSVRDVLRDLPIHGTSGAKFRPHDRSRLQCCCEFYRSFY